MPYPPDLWRQCRDKALAEQAARGYRPPLDKPAWWWAGYLSAQDAKDQGWAPTGGWDAYVARYGDQELRESTKPSPPQAKPRMKQALSIIEAYNRLGG